jgi:hypothetical protein
MARLRRQGMKPSDSHSNTTPVYRLFVRLLSVYQKRQAPRTTDHGRAWGLGFGWTLTAILGSSHDQFLNGIQEVRGFLCSVGKGTYPVRVGCTGPKWSRIHALLRHRSFAIRRLVDFRYLADMARELLT